MIKFNQFKKTKKAVSEIMGTLLILGISVSLFSVLYVSIFSTEPSTPSPSVNIIGHVDDQDIILEHRGGESLSLFTSVILEIGGNPIKIILGDGSYLKDLNGDGLWNIGEKVVIHDENIIGLQANATIVDTKSDTVIMMGALQKGIILKNPYVITNRYYNVGSYYVTFEMRYDFFDKSGKVYFEYKLWYETWSDADTTDKLDVSGFKNDFNQTIDSGLTPRTRYDFRAVMEYDSNVVYGNELSFKTSGIINGMWRFDEGSGRIAHDETTYENNGMLYTAGKGPLWVPGVNNTGLSYDGIDDYVKVNDSDSLDISKDITIEAWINTSEHSDGYFGNIIKNEYSSKFGISYCKEPDFIKISDNIFAVVCRANDEDGYLITVGISDSGVINSTIIDIFEFENSRCYYPDIIHINDSIYAIAYTGPSDDGYVKTVNISNNGQIENNFISHLEFNNQQGINPSIIYVNNTYYAIAYRDIDDYGSLTTVSISDNGETINFVDSSKFDTKSKDEKICDDFKLIHIYDKIFAVVYRNPDSDGEIRTVEIQDNGDITSPYHPYGYCVHALVFDNYDGWTPDIVHINEDIYAIAYAGYESPDTKGYLITLNISKEGYIINLAEENLLCGYKFDNNYARDMKIINVYDDIYAISYSGPGNAGWLKTVQIFNNGEINQTILNSYEFDTSDGYYPNILGVKDNVFAIIYTGPEDDGILKTINISNSGIIKNDYIDIFEIGVFDLELPDMININSNVYAMAYKGIDGNGYIKTFNIQNSGTIASSVIDSIRFHKGNILDPKLIQVNETYNLYAVAYSNQTTDSVWHGFIKTIILNDDGSIGEEKFEFEFDSHTEIIRPDIIHINGIVFAFVYKGVDDDGFINTINIANDGTISTINSNPVEFETSDCVTPDIFHINGQIYAIAYSGSSYHGYIKTLTIEKGGNIDISAMQSKKFVDSYCCYPEIINVSGNIYAIAYTGSNNDGWVKTVKINDMGDILNSDVDHLEFDGYYGYRPDIINIKDRVFAVSYTRYKNKYDDSGYIKTFRIGENGNITNSNDDSFEFDKYIYKSSKTKFIHIYGDFFAVIHGDSNLDCTVRTIKISYEEKERRVLSKSGAYTINANSNKVFAIINNHQISAPLNPGFNFITLTYNSSSDKMILFVNSTPISQKSFDEDIIVNDNHLYFGGVNSIIDEITIYEVVISDWEIEQHWHQFD